MENSLDQPVKCCFDTKSTLFLYELLNDQDAVPGYRHIRMNIQSHSAGIISTVRVKFCPFCGHEFKGAGIR